MSRTNNKCNIKVNILFINLIVCWLCVFCNAQTITTLSGLGTIPINSITDLYQVKDPQVQVTHSVTSLSQTKNQFAQGNVNFIVTQAPLLPSEHTQDACSGAWDVREFPLNVDGLVLIYTIPGIYTQNASSSAPRLILDRQAIVDIYSGVITSWNHPRIISLNPRLAERLRAVPDTPEATITPYYIQDSSLSQVFSAALSSFSQTWKDQQAAVGPNGWPYNARAIENGGGGGALAMRSTILGSYSAIGFVQYSTDTTLVNALITNRAGNAVAYSASTAISAVNDFSADVQASLRATEARSSDYPSDSLIIVDGAGQNSWPFAHFNMITTRVKGFSDCLKSGKMIDLLQFVRTSEVGTVFTKVQQGLLTEFNVALNDLTSTLRCCQSSSGGGSVTKISIHGQGTDFGSLIFGRVASIFNTVPAYTATVSYSSSPSSSVQDILGNSSNVFTLSTSSPDLGAPFHSLQVFGASVVCVYNAQGVSSLSLTREQMVGIFSGTISRWSDLSSSYPNEPIVRILEADPDVSSIFSSALQFSSVFTTSTQDTTLSRLGQTPFSIGIVALNSAIFSDVSVARFTTSEGASLSPSNTSAITASLAGASSGMVWPITSFVWVTFKVEASTFCTSVNNLAQFIYWTATDPQALSSFEGSLSVRPASATTTGSTLAAISCSQTPILNPVLVIPGAGSSFAAGVYQSWLSTYAFIDASVRFTYNPTGSGNGINAITAGTVVWAGSDAALTQTQANAGGDLQLYPAFAGSVVLAYRIDQLPQGSPPLNLTRELIVDIYSGNVRAWNDARIAELNPAVASYLPDAAIVLVYRSDSSGTTNIFSTALRSFSTSWTIPSANTIAWPVPGITAEGSSGMGLRIFSTANTLGYVELSYAAVNGLSYSNIRNKAGKWVSPTSAAVQSAMTDFKDSFLPDFTCSIVDGQGEGSWPLAAYTYLILRSRSMTDLTTARKMLQFILWAVAEDVPSQRVQDLGFTPLSDSFVTDQLIPKLQDVEVNGVSVLGRPEKESNNNRSIGLGIGLGLGLPLVLIVILFFLYMRHVKRRKVPEKAAELENFTIEADEWADEGVELQPLSDSLGIRIGNGSDLLRFGIAKGTRFPVMQTLTEKIQLVNESSTDKNFAFYVPHDANRFKLVLVPGYGALKPGAEMTVEARFTLLMTTTIARKVKFEVLGCGEQQIPLQLAGDVSTRLDPNEIDILGKPIGQGAFGTVYRGTYRGTQVAVKVLARQNELLKAQTDEFLKEIDLMHKLRSPFIVGFIGASYVPGKLCVLTEYMERGSVAHMLRKIKIEHALRLKIAYDCALAMSFLHNNGVMHRDLKPANLLVSSLSSSAEVTIKLADFGTSRTVTQIYAEGRHTNGWGTPGYMSPELLSRGEYSGKVDVYAFGIMLLELWTQKDPFAFMKKIWDLPDYIVGGNRPEIPADMPADYTAIIKKCWTTIPEDRPTFPELATILEPMYTAERARAKENKRKLIEAGLTPTKTAYENGTYVSRGSNSSAGVPLSNTQAETINLSDFSFSEDTSTRTATLDPMRVTQRDHTRSATTDVMRAMLANPLANRGKERVIGVTGMTGGPHNNLFYGTNGPHSNAFYGTNGPNSPMYSSRNPHFPPMASSSSAASASSSASGAHSVRSAANASSGAGVMSPAPAAARIGTNDSERLTSLANLSNDNISDDRHDYFTKGDI